MKIGHAGQIVTTRKTITGLIYEIQLPVTYNTVCLISDGLKGEYDLLRLYSVCSRLYYLSKLVYVGENGVAKLTPDQYRKELFAPHAETLAEVEAILERKKKDFSDNHAKEVFRCLQTIEHLWCTSMACVCEQIYIPELAYAFDYVIKRKGELPEPEFQGAWSIFPQNYEDYNYTEGIAEYFEDVMEACFRVKNAALLAKMKDGFIEIADDEVPFYAVDPTKPFEV